MLLRGNKNVRGITLGYATDRTAKTVEPLMYVMSLNAHKADAPAIFSVISGSKI
jgi:hypothetical protein